MAQADHDENIDLPIRHYSTGMKVRQGFAVIAHLSHPILLVDEVLAVDGRQLGSAWATTERTRRRRECGP